MVKKQKINLLRKITAIMLLLTVVFSSLFPSVSHAAEKETTPTLTHTGTQYIAVSQKVDINVKDKIGGSKYTWSSSDNKIAKVDKKGVVTGVKEGKVTITCAIKVALKEYTLSTKFVVVQKAEKIVITNKIDTMAIGETYDLNRKITPLSSKEKTTWVSSNEKIAKPDSVGKFTALKTGTVTITAKTTSGKKDSVKIKVVDQVIVTTQEELTKALKNKKIKNIVLKTDAEETIIISKGTYKEVVLVVDAPNAEVENEGIFKNITIKNLKQSTWIEKAKGNSFVITANNVRVIIEKEAVVNSINILGKNATIISKGEIIGGVVLSGIVDLTIEGTSDKYIEIKLIGDGSHITTSVPVTIDSEYRVDVVIKKGAEKSLLHLTNKESNVTSENDVKNVANEQTGTSDNGGNQKEDEKLSVLWNWKDVELSGMGWVTGVISAPTAPYNIYCKTDVGGIYKYNRTTERWEFLLNGFGLDERSAFSIDGLAVNPQNGDEVYFAGNGTDNRGEIFKSTDAGKTWAVTGLRDVAAIKMDGNGDYRAETGERLAVDPNNGDVIYFGSRHDGLWKKVSDNPWEKVQNGLPATTDAKSGYDFIVFDENSGTVKVSGLDVTKIFYVGRYADDDGNGVYKTVDGGQTFIKLKVSEVGIDQAVHRAAVNGEGVLCVTVAIDGNGYIITAQREEDTLVKRLEKKGTPLSGIDVSPKDNKTFVVMSNSADPVFTSTDNGVTWTETKQNLAKKIPYQNTSWCHNDRAPFTFDKSDKAGNTGFMGTGFGVIRTQNLADAISTWDDCTLGISELVVNTIVTTPLLGGYDLHTGVWDMGGFSIPNRYQVPDERLISSVPGGAPEWGIPLTNIAGMDYCYSQPEYMVYSGFHEFGLHDNLAWKYGVTTDGGYTWKEISTPTKDTTAEFSGPIAMSSQDPNVLVWSPINGILKYSTDMGETWKDATIDFGVPLTTKGLRASLVAGLDKSAMYERFGEFWPHVQNIAADRVDGNTFYLFTETNSNLAQFFVSKDGGKTWNKTYTGYEADISDENFVPTSSAEESDGKIDSALLPFTNVRVNPVKQGDVFIAIRPGFEGSEGTNAFAYKPLWRSTDGTCTNFVPVKNVQACLDVAFGKGDTDDMPYIYILGMANGDKTSGVYMSKDNGKTWICITDKDHQFGNSRTIAADMRIKNRVYIGASGRGLMCGEPFELPTVEIKEISTAQENIRSEAKHIYKVGTDSVTVNFDAVAYKGQTIKKLELYNGAEKITTIENKNNGSYEFVEPAEGLYRLYVKAYDNAGNEQTSSPMYFEIKEEEQEEKPVIKEVIQNNSFESGTQYWSAGGDTSKLRTSGDAYSGDLSGNVYDRGKFWEGLTQDITGRVIPNKTYHFSAFVKLPNGVADNTMEVLINYTIDGEQEQSAIVTANVYAGKWTQITGTVTMREDTDDASSITLSIQEGWPGSQSATLAEYYIDNVYLTLEETQEYDQGAVNNGSFETGDLAPWFNWASQVEITDAVSKDGTYSAHVHSVEAFYAGLAQNLTGRVDLGAKYAFSAWVKLPQGAPSGTMEVQINYTFEEQEVNSDGDLDNKTARDFVVMNQSITSSEWTKIQGDIVLRTDLPGETIQNIQICISEPYPGGMDATIEEYYIDGISFTKDDSKLVKVDASVYEQGVSIADSKLVKVPYGTPTLSFTDSLWDGAATITPNIITGSTTNTATIKLLWDENYLYLLADIKDSDLDSTGAQEHEKDSLEVMIDEFFNRSTKYQKDDSQSRVTYNNVQSGGKEGLVESYTKTTPDGYMIVQKIAFTYINPIDNGIIGVDVQINDAAGGSRIGTINWVDDTGNGWDSTANFGAIVFEKKDSNNTPDTSGLNMIKNGDFNTDISEWSKGDGSDITLEKSNDGREGTSALYVKNRVNYYDKLVQELDAAKLTGGAEYDFSAWVYLPVTIPSAKFYVEIEYKTAEWGNVPRVDYIEQNIVSGWNHIEGTLAIYSDVATSPNVKLIMQEAWLSPDDAQMTEFIIDDISLTLSQTN